MDCTAFGPGGPCVAWAREGACPHVPETHWRLDDKPRNLTMESGMAALDAMQQGSSYEPTPMLLHPSLMRALRDED